MLQTMRRAGGSGVFVCVCVGVGGVGGGGGVLSVWLHDVACCRL